MQPQAFVCSATARPISIHLELEVVAGLSLTAMEALKSVPRRGLEIGGLLLGRTETDDGKTTVYIEAYQPVESEHRSGPSYRLSESDLQNFDAAFKRHGSVVGVYRTQTRSEDLTLQESDTGLFYRYFTDADGVFLLIQPLTRKAEFFLPEGGSLLPVEEFPFRPGDLATPVVPPVKLPETERIVLALPPPPRSPLPARRNRLWPLVAIAALLGGACLGALVIKIISPGSKPVEVKPPVPVSAQVTPPLPAEHLGLDVQHDGRQLRLRWDRNARPIRDAAKAVLEIKDGDHQSQLTLNGAELRSGLLSYWPETQDVTFRLEVVAADQTLSESVRAVNGASVPPVVTPAPVATPPPTVTTQRRQRPQGLADRSDLEESRPSPFDPPGTRPKPTPASAPVVPVSKPVTAPVEPVDSNPASVPPVSLAPPSANSVVHTQSPQVSVVAEPVSGSRFGSVVGKIPLLRRLRKEKVKLVPPTPVHRVDPVLSAQERRQLQRAIPVDVKVYVAESGKVQYAELLSGGGHRDLAAAAVYAARKWDFTPARLGEDKVPGEVILHFRFGPAEVGR